MMRRYWINTPSTNQPDHEYHGTNVLADMQDNRENDYTSAYFLEGATTSMRIKKKTKENRTI
ncbi:MAG: hypothetical protein ACTSSK_03630 [Candidatus Heimdallarchaeota archaeon]